MIKLEIHSGQDGKNLLSCVTELMPGIRPGDAKKILKRGDIKINGVRTKKDEPVHAGDILEAYIPDSMAPYPKLDIAYEDENLIIVNKEPGISVVEDRDDGKPTLLSLVVKYMMDKNIYIKEAGNVPFACHRLDHFTGGLTIFTKNGEYLDYITQAFAQRRISKFYRAIVVGAPPKPSDELNHFLEKDAGAARVRITSKPSRTALPVVTRYTTLKTNGELSLLEIELVTGRTHQIRAHLASIGIPVLGDDKYGNRKANKKYGVRYQALWSTKLKFNTGRNNPLSYVDGLVVETDKIGFPYVEL
jgi:RluA family pseudouridine synthase